ncbi:bifunctional phosphopantothenoylcysteine decarboxylase/phosphopantothenate--cysteine ligase CoaBC [Corynebacterium mendelii]|uniref:bifunctional phosphopantothenoylcysteine decarboxylase/phosphopantothenate--cysteine ligase CoaBC n=1 Tax=Corynebacterium mendelii TaxID=2765362 RepID=UPI001F5C807A|nr:bifunctional phosphopantothenoylcysteine decarboxylase/phosphopantothenate--cysteine ligase CoaBC [Corynebacterium mendelii]
MKTVDQQPARIVVGVTGGIAAYKACHLVRALTETGCDVTVIPTENALRFVGAATFEALSHNPVTTGVFEHVDSVRHVSVGKNADLVVVAPATADFMARLAAGMAHDMLTATCLTATCPIVVAPAMHTEMWFNPATQANVSTLRGRGITVLEPASGRLTGKDTGTGRLPEPEQIHRMASLVRETGSLSRLFEGKKLLVTAGGTREDIDPVRFVGNRSSGKQGFALAEVAAHMGAEVSVIAAATDCLPTPCGARLIRVRSALELAQEVNHRAADTDIVIMAAAVADFRPTHTAGSKIKKAGGRDSLGHIELTENPDILAGLVHARRQGQLPEGITLVGFAAETGDDTAGPLEHGRAKLATKGVDLLMVNDVSDGQVFGRNINAGWVLGSNGSVTTIERGDKFVVARRILEAVAARF